ncbi:MAG TPA: ribbon-helix-helix domain-containing protein [Candidatus Bathyarchaeia archaeon]|nr:ribbon-helix-helix domain-containing protein [Candidatus Bathyarchaeia archaeon]
MLTEYEWSLVRPDERRKKARISIAIDREFLVWIDGMIKKGVFANRSHAIHRALLKLKEEGTK